MGEKKIDLVDYALGLISNLVTLEGSTYLPALDQDTRGKSILVLDHYRNNVQHLFSSEGMLACAFYSSQDKEMKRKDLIEQAQFLETLLHHEFVNTPSPQLKLVWLCALGLLLTFCFVPEFSRDNRLSCQARSSYPHFCQG